MKYIDRAAQHDVQHAIRHFPVVLITGARQVGKSTLALHLDGYHYVTLDDLTLFSAVQDDPHGVIESLRKPVIIDEIQKAPALLSAIKKHVDADRVNGRFILTGSANVLAFKDVSDTLAGRMALFELMPFSQREYRLGQGNFVDLLFERPVNELPVADMGRRDIIDAVVTGGYPEALKISDAKGRYIWFSSYIRSYIERDVRDIGEIRNLDGFIRLHHLLAVRSGNILNKTELGKACALDQKTLANYLMLLEQVFQIQILRSFSSNIGKRFMKNPKLFFNDSGILAHLLSVHDQDDFLASPYKGLLLETFVFAELRKHISLASRQTNLSFYRTVDKKEIDFILARAGQLMAIEVKLSRSVNSKDFQAIRILQQASSESFKAGLVLYSGEELLSFGDNLWAAPLAILF